MKGADFPMRDAAERVVGTIPFVLDHEVPGMVHAKAVRSPVPHARILDIDASVAKHHPGVLAVITGADLVDHAEIHPYYGSGDIEDHPALAIDKVRYAGEAVALVIAQSSQAARQAVVDVIVDYDELPPVVDEVQAMKDCAPLVHEDHPDNVCARWTLRHGDPDFGFAEADRIYDEVYTSPPASHVPMEPHVCVASWNEGHLEIWTGTQAPHAVREALAKMMRVTPEAVRVHTFNLGGAYGAKTTTKIEPMVACATRIMRRPVRVELDRDEVFQTIGKHSAQVRVKTAVTDDGRLLARDLRVVWNAGAYADTSRGGSHAGLVRAPGPYRIPHVKVESVAVYTNTVPSGPFRGAYTSQTCWAYESQLDDIAADLGIDPVEIRRRNLLRDGDTYATGEKMHEMHFTELLDAAAASIDWSGPKIPSAGWRRGTGVAVMIKSATTPSRSEARLRLTGEGKVIAYSSSVEMGQGANATLVQLVATELELSPDRIELPFPDTAEAPYDLKTAASRTTFTMGSAMRRAARAMKQRLSDLAAEQLEVDQVGIFHSGGCVGVVGDPSSLMPYEEVLAAAGIPEVTVEGVYQSEAGLRSLDPATGQGIAADHWHQGAVAVEVAVDSETGKIEVLRCHGASYAGRAVSPFRVRQQNEGGMIFALGQALFEELIYDNGSLVNPNLSDYMVPSILDIPHSITSSAVESEDPDADLYGVGEMVVPALAPAVANALFGATGVRVRELPLTPERVLRALEKADSDE